MKEMISLHFNCENCFISPESAYHVCFQLYLQKNNNALIRHEEMLVHD